MAYAEGIVSRGNTYNVNPTAIVRRAGFNPRVDFGNIAELAESIKANGVINPLRVRRNADNKLELIDGDRRFTAIEQLMANGHEFTEGVPVIMEAKTIDDTQALTLMFVSNQGKPFTPYEEAEAFKRMRDAGMTLKQIASASGRATVNVGDRLGLLEASPKLREAVESGEINVTTANSIIRQTKGLGATEEGHAQQAALLDKAKTEGASMVKAGETVTKLKKRKTTEEKESADDAKPATPDQLAKRIELIEAEIKALQKTLGINGTMSNLVAVAKQDDKTTLAYRVGIVKGLQFALGMTKSL